MAWTQDDADTLKAAIASGTREVTYSDGSRIVYRSLADMQRTLAMIEAEVAGTGTARVRAVRFNGAKGF